MEKLTNKNTWTPNESDVEETRQVFNKEIRDLIKKVNKHWFDGKAQNQAKNMISEAVKKG